MLTSLLVGFKICFQEIGEKEYFQNHKHDKQLNKNNDPNLFAPLPHVLKTIYIKVPGLDKDI